MKKRGWVVLCLAMGMTTLVQAQPNIILIMADDLGYECIGANGDSEYSTPVLDGLAENGMRFEHCYSQPLCTPSRVKIMTGISNVRNYIEFALLDPNATTFGNLMKQAGYTTAIAGKWQLGTDPAQPEKFGFDEYCLWHLPKKNSRYNNLGSLLLNTGEVLSGGYGPDKLNAFVLDFITRHKDGPFFCYYPMLLTHAPFEPTPDSKTRDGSAHENFADMVTYMDKMVGQVIDRLDELGLRENTLVLFTGDNGTHRSLTTQFNGKPYKGGKGSMPNAGTHVPLIANWPGTVPSSKVSQDLIEFSDFLPTLCEAAGATVPAGLQIDGKSFFAQLKGERGNPRKWTHCWYSSEGTEPSEEWVRNQRYKFYRDGKFYDVQNDALEKKPLQINQLSEQAMTVHAMLQKALGRYAGARPQELIKTLDQLDTKRAKKKQKNR
ncbi:sulfatase-like hydrolase/transferase [Pontiella sulfatireligans]|uniref:Arylsulfatase n=1 Tax=Pontiella sulfatireligans TaxID=2750658 RepID=A0A6C2UL56_9BACT|nr:sulfatase-like hydrolase/transferase [Pontiella sulfatireligans]SPS74439.1 sulfatase S1_24 [Kiritimatiellales bacterium]VGO20699.1 Arylsulfatase [Pontiella sulfatireligans]